MKPYEYYMSTQDAMVAGMFKAKGWNRVFSPAEADVHVFVGGADVSPAMYGDVRHSSTGCIADRDIVDLDTFAASEPKLRVGICRGGQFLNVVSGGTMWQDADNHAIGQNHHIYVRLPGGEPEKGLLSVEVTSTHHQIMRMGPGAVLWGWTQLSTYRDTGNDWKRPVYPGEGVDNEILWYPATRSLCFQPHPEYTNRECRGLFFRCIDAAMESI